MELILNSLLANLPRAIAVSLGLFLFFAASIYLSWLWGAPWVITRLDTVHEMLELVELKERETLYDLGSGDGRILIQAARDYKTTAIGVEIDPLRVFLAKIFIWRRGLGKSAKIRWGNFFSYDISEADVVTLYLTRETNLKLREHLEKMLAPGTRVVSNSFTIPGWTPTKIDNRNLLFMYIIGKTGDSTQTQFVQY